MLEQVKGLYDLGFAIHLLKNKSKMPIKKGWTQGSRESWVTLKNDYKTGMNVGVRLGAASKIGDKFLAVIDCDVKSKDPKHLKEMSESLKNILKGQKTPAVLSGRGNGSKHFYVLTEKPLMPKRFSQSNEKVKIKMNVTPSKHELSVLTKEEIKDGVRLRAAWEISLMGEGQQVVLPPSIHPDSGKAYEWVPGPFRPIVLDIEGLEFFEGKVNKTVLNDFKAVPFDLYGSTLSDSTIDLIVHGKNCEDRSRALYGITIEMLSAGFSEAQILSCLTDKEFYIGGCAYDHAKTNSRKRAAEWVLNFTLKKAKTESALSAEFDSEVVETRILSDSEAEDQAKDIILKSDDEWRKNVKRNQKTHQILNSFHNIKTILCGVMGNDKFIMRDLFKVRDLWTVSCPWGSKKDATISDDDSVMVKAWLSKKFKFEPSTKTIDEVFIYLAVKNAQNPLRDWLLSLKWDGKPRINTWLEVYLDAVHEPKEYLKIVSRRFLVGMVGRVLQPGVKFDQVLILEGFQGKGKGSAANILAGDEYFSDSPITIGDKDAVGGIQGVWVQELAELASVYKSDIESLKSFITQRVDKARLPYGKRYVDYPRQTVFIGTTNDSQYLKDDSGERRYWPVKVGQTKFDELREAREQLLAEAVEAFLTGEFINEECISDDPKLSEMFLKVKTERKIQDPLEENLQIFLDSKHENFNPLKFRMCDLIGAAVHVFHGQRDSPQLHKRVGSILRKSGYEIRPVWHKTGTTRRLFKTWVLDTSKK